MEPNSPLIAELQSLAAEAQLTNGEAFTYDGKDYIGVAGIAQVSMGLAIAGYEESSGITLVATLGQFGEAVPVMVDASQRKIVTLRGRSWKVTGIENDGLYIKFALKLEQ